MAQATAFLATVGTTSAAVTATSMVFERLRLHNRDGSATNANTAPIAVRLKGAADFAGNAIVMLDVGESVEVDGPILMTDVQAISTSAGQKLHLVPLQKR